MDPPDAGAGSALRSVTAPVPGWHPECGHALSALISTVFFMKFFVRTFCYFTHRDYKFEYSDLGVHLHLIESDNCKCYFR